MKYLLLLLPLISFAKVKLNITNSEGQQMSKEFESLTEANDYIAQFKSKWGRDAGWLRFDCGNSTSTRIVEELGENITEYDCPATYTTSITDITTESTFRTLEEMAAKNMSCGKSVKAFIGALNVSKGLTQTQIKQIILTYAEINSYLDGGALDTAITEIALLTADGVLITESDKTNIVSKINSCKVIW